MANPSAEPAATKWSTANVYLMAGACLIFGLVVGYLFRGSESKPTLPSATISEGLPATPSGVPPQRPTMAQMKQMADAKAAPLLAKLATDPNNAKLLAQVASLYSATHQFNDAIIYYNRAVSADPKNVALRTEMASCLFYNGDIDGAIGQLQNSLTYDPKNANALFNLGMIKWRGKNDAAGAIASWQTLLRTNPQLDRRPVVEKMIAEAKLGKAPAASER